MALIPPAAAFDDEKFHVKVWGSEAVATL